MGYREPLTTALMVFDGTHYEGAEIRCRLTVPTRIYLDLERMVQGGKASDLDDAFSAFGDLVLVEWNIEDPVSGEPLPATGDGFRAISPQFATAVLKAWLERVSDADAPLGSASPNGSTSAEALETTAAL